MEKPGRLRIRQKSHCGTAPCGRCLIAAVYSDGGIDDPPFQQAGKKPSGDCQVIALFSISFQLQGLNDAEVLCIIAPRHNSARDTFWGLAAIYTSKQPHW